jgi:hypothetical protein
MFCNVRLMFALHQRYRILGPGAPHVRLSLFLALTNPWAVMLLGDLYALVTEPVWRRAREARRRGAALLRKCRGNGAHGRRLACPFASTRGFVAYRLSVPLCAGAAQ